MKFRSVIELGGKTATGFEVPDEVVASLGSHKRPAVRVTIGNHTYRSTIAVMGGRFLLPLSQDNREQAGVQAGDEVEVTVELDAEPRTVAVPPDLQAALESNPVALKRFEALSNSGKQRHVIPIEQAKTDETRRRRVAKDRIASRAGLTGGTE